GNRMIAAPPRRAREALPASTEWRVLGRSASHALIECVAHTGRMHQVRVHLAHAGAPIAGDAQYGGAPLPAGMIGHFLHASAITLPHPRTRHGLRIDAPLP